MTYLFTLTLLASALASGCKREADTIPATAPGAAIPAGSSVATPAPAEAGPQLVVPDADVSDLPITVQTKMGDLRYQLRLSATDVKLVAELGALCYVHKQPRVAIACFKHNTVLEPNALAWWYYLGLAYESAGEKAPATAAYEKAVALQDYPPIRARLAALGGGSPAATRPATGTQPATPDLLYQNLLRYGLDIGALLDAASIAIQEGQLAPAERLVREALSIDEADVRGRTELGRIHGLQGKLDDAVRELKSVLSTPEGQQSVSTKLVLANFLTVRKEYDHAVPLLREALAQSPEAADVMNSLAWILAAHPDPGGRKPDEAVKMAEKACELTGQRNAALLDTLSVAYAAAGRFDDAKQRIGEAMRLAQEARQMRALQTYEQRHALYEKGQAYYETR